MQDTQMLCAYTWPRLESAKVMIFKVSQFYIKVRLNLFCLDEQN